jgi:predicted DNA-binding protein
MKIKAAPKRDKRPEPISFRLSKMAVKQLNELSKATGKTKTQIIEEVIAEAHSDTIK